MHEFSPLKHEQPLISKLVRDCQNNKSKRLMPVLTIRSKQTKQSSNQIKPIGNVQKITGSTSIDFGSLRYSKSGSASGTKHTQSTSLGQTSKLLPLYEPTSSSTFFHPIQKPRHQNQTAPIQVNISQFEMVSQLKDHKKTTIKFHKKQSKLQKSDRQIEPNLTDRVNQRTRALSEQIIHQDVKVTNNDEQSKCKETHSALLSGKNFTRNWFARTMKMKQHLNQRLIFEDTEIDLPASRESHLNPRVSNQRKSSHSQMGGYEDSLRLFLPFTVFSGRHHSSFFGNNDSPLLSSPKRTLLSPPKKPVQTRKRAPLIQSQYLQPWDVQTPTPNDFIADQNVKFCSNQFPL